MAVLLECTTVNDDNIREASVTERPMAQGADRPSRRVFLQLLSSFTGEF